MSGLVATYQLRLQRGPHEAALDRMARHMGAVERQLHVALIGAHREAAAETAAMGPAALEAQEDEERNRIPGPLPRRLNAIKVAFLAQHGITGRHYNSILRHLEGRYDSLREIGKAHLETLQDKLKTLEKKIVTRGKKIASFKKTAAQVDKRAKVGKGPTKAQARTLMTRTEQERACFVQHNQKRRAQALKDRIASLKIELARDIPGLVFGGKDLLRERSRIGARDDQGLAVWRRRWQETRSAGFLAMGSKDETAGCQTCVGSMDAGGNLSLRLRLPDAISQEDARHLTLEGLELPEFGRAEITAALLAHRLRSPERRAISYRFLRDSDWAGRNSLSAWRICITIDQVIPEPAGRVFETLPDRRGNPGTAACGLTEGFLGAIGVDINADHLAWAVIDRHGNPVAQRSGRIDLPLRGKCSGHRATLIGNAARELVSLAEGFGLPLVLEQLDFRQKKRAMGKQGAGYSRMLSSFAYGAIQKAIRRRALRAGVELVDVNPAYSSLIGRTNLAKRYGLTVHVSAAVVIARRAARFSERINYIHGHRGRRNTLPTQSESRRHVWRQWALVLRDEIAAHKRDTGSRPAAGVAISSSSPTSSEAKGGIVRSGSPKAPARGGGVGLQA